MFTKFGKSSRLNIMYGEKYDILDYVLGYSEVKSSNLLKYTGNW